MRHAETQSKSSGHSWPIGLADLEFTRNEKCRLFYLDY